VLDAIHEHVLPLAGYQPVTLRTKGELMRRARLGI